MMPHYISDYYGNVWPVEHNFLIPHMNQCDCGKDIPYHKGNKKKPLCPHCHCYQGKDGCNDCECLGEEE